jgi:hypothetical protein
VWRKYPSLRTGVESVEQASAIQKKELLLQSKSEEVAQSDTVNSIMGLLRA